MTIFSGHTLPNTGTTKCYKYILALPLAIFVLTTIVFSQSVPATACKGKNKKTHSLPGSAKLLKEYTVSGKVTQTSPYCGGARPPKELLDRLATPVAYPNKKFYIRQGKVNSVKAKVIKSFTTDSAGEFSVQLAPGTYSIIQEEQLHKIKAVDYTKKYQVVDNKCLQEWWVKPYYLLEVKDNDIRQLNFNFHHRCYIAGDIPCITYTGPLHP